MDEQEIIVEFINKDANYTREVPYSIMKLSKLVSDAVDNNPDDEESDDDDDKTGPTKHPIDLAPNNVTSEVLEKVIEFCTYYQEEPMSKIPSPFPESDDLQISDLVQKWYADFCAGLERKVLFQLLISANYMNIQPLLDLSCLAVAKHIHKKSEDEIREIFNIKKPELAENKEQDEAKA